MTEPSKLRLTRTPYKKYVLGVLAIIGLIAYQLQLRSGLGVTGLSRDVTWGIYISQFTFLVGVAASSVLVVLPYYVHEKKDGASLLLMGEVVAIVALLEAFSFILVDLGRPSRVLGVLLYASPTSLMFWDILALTSYFIVCSTILIIHLLRRYGQSQHWLRPIALTSVPLAFGIHIVTAMLYSGLVARVGWLTAVLAPKFLATALTSGAALLLLVSRYVENSGLLPIPYITRARLAAVMTYSLGASILLVCLESFTALYSGLPTAKEYQSHHFSLQDPGFASWMVFASVASIGAMIALLLRNRLQSRGLLEISSAAVLASVMIEKGIIFAPSGFVPSVVGSPTFYRPSLIEILIVLGIHSGGILVAAWLMRLTIFHRTHSDSPLVVTPMSDSTPSVGASGGPPFVTVSSSR